MLFPRFSRALLPATLLALGLATLTHAEEKSLWQKFKDFFSPTPTVEGDGPEYDKLRELDKRINTLEGKYSRERRPNNKANIRKEIDKLKEEREALAEQIRKNPPQPATQPNSSTAASSATPVQESAAPTCKTDTVLVRDTVVVHDTLYVIVADKAATAPTSSAKQAADSAQATPAASPAQASADSSQASQPGTK